MANKTSQHILASAVNLLGFCLIIITSLHIGGKTKNSLVDEFASGIAIILILSVIFSFISIRTEKISMEEKLETIADYLFALALVGILCIILLILSNFWNQ